ncbi:DUF5677 domain-containing protein [Flavihumibacter sp.]|uniref:DUF5677 domain-containing protein n=1 Tax=Flavihumibacter sp. TaxID=1913981 RepID=UPI002FC9C7AA
MTTPIKEIINRQVPTELLEVIKEFTDIIEESVNYGSQLLYSDSKSKSGGEENLPAVMLFRHFLDILDSISILTNKGTGDTAKILIRALFETTLFLDYLFEKDTEERSLNYIVSDIRRQIRSAKKFSPHFNDSKKLLEIFEKEGFSPQPDILQLQQVTEFIKSKEKLLASESLVGYNLHFEKAIKKGYKNPPWYSVKDGPRNIEALAGYLNQKSTYELLYRKWSGTVHGTDVYLGKVFASNKEHSVSIVQLRYLKDLQEVVLFSTLFTYKIFRLYVSKRLPEKSDEFTKWYIQSREAFLKINALKLIVK